MRIIQERTGDPHGWMTGLTDQEQALVTTGFPRTAAQLDAVVAKLRRLHPDLFNQAPPPSGRADGDGARAITDAEAALAQQNTAASQLDLQVVSAVLNAHLTTAAGRDALDKLQQDVEAAVRTRSDLDTPTGARDFQRFLIGKLRDIREVVATASLDDTSKAALMAAWTSLYNASNPSNNGPDKPGDPKPAAPVARGGDPLPPVAADAGSDPLLDTFLMDDPSPPATATPTPVAPPPPSSGGGAAPAGGSLPTLSSPGNLPLPSLGTGGGTGRASGDGLRDGLQDGDTDGRDIDGHQHDADDDTDEDTHGDPDEDTREEGKPEGAPIGPTTVTLPNGETVTAASPQLAAAIKAAAGGTPIAEAFQQQGIAIPPPGTAVSTPIDAARVAPGDIGMFTDRHALALGRSKALLDGQIQHISTVAGPSFLGWEHPPTTAAQTPPADTPTPTRPSANSTHATAAAL